MIKHTAVLFVEYNSHPIEVITENPEKKRILLMLLLGYLSSQCCPESLDKMLSVQKDISVSLQHFD